MPNIRPYIVTTAASVRENSSLVFSLGVEKKKKENSVILVFLFLLFSLLTARQLEVEFNLDWFVDCASGRVVSSNCHSRAVANIDFKLCRSQKDSHSARRKVDSSSSEAKIVRIGAGKKMFSSRPERGANGLSFFALEGKIEQRIRNFGEKTVSRSRSFKMALCSLDAVCRKLRQTLQKPSKSIK